MVAYNSSSSSVSTKKENISISCHSIYKKKKYNYFTLFYFIIHIWQKWTQCVHFNPLNKNGNVIITQTNNTHTHTQMQTRCWKYSSSHTHLISRSTITILIRLPVFNDDITTPIIGYCTENTIETIISLVMHLILCLIADRMTYEDSRYTIGVQNLCLIVSLIRESRRYTCTRGKTRVLEKPGIMNDTGRARTSVCQC